MSLFAELKRRNVFRVAIAYVVIAWLILQVGEVLRPALHLPEWVNSLLAFFLILGFPLAVFFAWAFELTPEGLKREKEVDRNQSITHVTGRKMDFAIIALLLLALGYFVADKFWLQTPNAVDEATTAQEEAGKATPSIAVLPLADMSPKGDSAYFSDGLTEELLNILAKISELRVAGRTSSFAFKGQNEDLREIGRKLDVDHILEGSVRKDDARNRVRITLQLIDTDSGYHLWSETYDRDLDDIFAIQEDVAHQVAKALRVTLLGEDEQRIEQLASTDINAYDLYLQGTQELRKAGFVNLERAVDLFQQVLAIDPGYVPARLGLVAAWGQMANTGAISTQQAVERGVPLLEQVLAAQPDNARAQALQAWYLAGQQKDEEAAVVYRRALELAPRDATTLANYGRFIYDNGEVARGMAVIDEAVSLDPLNITVLFDQCQTNAHQRELQAALSACARLRELAPDGPQSWYGEGLAYAYMGELAKAAAGFAEAIQRDPGDFEMQSGMAQFWIAMGDAEQAGAWLDRADAIGAGQPLPTSARVLFLEFREQHDLAGQLAAQALARDMEDRHGANFVLRRANAMHALRTGNLEQGLAPFRALYPWAFATPLVLPDPADVSMDALLHVAALMKHADPLSSRPDELLAYVEAHVDQHPPGFGKSIVPMRRAAISTLRGNAAEAIGFLAEARKLGPDVFWRPSTVDDPVISQLAGEPAFRQYVAEIEAVMDRQREEAYALLEIPR